MRSRLFAIMHKEFIHIFRDPQTLGIVLIVPISMLLLMGYAVAADIDHIPTAVFDQAMDSQSRDFLEKFWQTDFFLFCPAASHYPVRLLHTPGQHAHFGLLRRLPHTADLFQRDIAGHRDERGRDGLSVEARRPFVHLWDSGLCVERPALSEAVRVI